jgi:hypothetical protein
MLPLHSMTAFFWGMMIAYDFNKFPSFLVFSVGWIFLACNEYALRHPSPWHKSRRYFSLLTPLILGVPSYERIEKNTNLEAIKEYEEKQAKIKKQKQEEAELELKQQQQLQKEFGDGQDIDITTEKGSLLPFAVNPLKPILHPVQLQLGGYVIQARIVKSILLWQETYYAFWITTCSLVGSLVIFWVPWAFLLRWTMRIVFFLCSGPLDGHCQRLL